MKYLLYATGIVVLVFMVYGAYGAACWEIDNQCTIGYRESLREAIRVIRE